MIRPDISDVRINFTDGYGLYGEPKVAPREVTLYGPEEALSHITELKALPVEINDVSKSRSYQIGIDTSWKQYGDIYASTEELTLTLPVENYVERQYTLPVTVEGLDTSVHLRLYPEQVVVQVWVAQRDIASVTAERFSVSADYGDILAGAPRLTLRLSRFPESVRPRAIIPSEAQYVIIK